MNKTAEVLEQYMAGEPELTDGQYHHAKLAMEEYAKLKLEEYLSQSSKRMKVYVPVSSSIEPEKEGRYIVSNGLVWFEVNWDKEFGFHEEFTDCPGITTWLKETELCVCGCDGGNKQIQKDCTTCRHGSKHVEEEPCYWCTNSKALRKFSMWEGVQSE